MSSSWNDTLQSKLPKDLAQKYLDIFPSGYCEECPIDVALIDIEQMEKLSATNNLEMVFYVSQRQNLHLRLFQFDTAIPLSDVLPMLEHMGLRTVTERPYKIPVSNTPIWISDFTVAGSPDAKIDIERVKDIFKEAFIQIRHGNAENDGFNKLVLTALLSWREVSVLRAYAKYLHQAGFRFSQNYIEKALANNPDITKNLSDLFQNKFNPKQKDKGVVASIEEKIQAALEAVTSLDEDRILRRLLAVIKATLRTNYFQTLSDGSPKPYISLKFSSRDVPELPLPLPLFEIFVYAPRFEGIHLRNEKVARGGIRWSDRREDFRTEVLGLMKAQKVKNSVIVPSGAKGGFVLKMLPPSATRDAIQAEVVMCYKSFIRGLLDLTDNLKTGKVIPPKDVVSYDEVDTYLVVAADKGTATFSDTANQLSAEYEFWLGDAFASGGSQGYDHKKMGITARGAWESVKRHFRELDINPELTDFTVVGVGDMSGDVFGNGLIYTPHIKLLAAFDHRHIFIDPNPNPETTFQERLRLFALPTSSWEDFNPALISKGGGVFKRSSKSITISPEAQAALGITESTLVPTELLRAILKAPVDLLWNGGIGTYVKASTESHADVGDKTNEFCRINGNELRCRIVGEGGNLGFTQLGRIEFALQGGLINTDFIDNSAGVDCSDHEVNIKILLNAEVQKGNLSEENRNVLLTAMTDEVGNLVLADNYKQALVMSFSHFHVKNQLSIYQAFLRDLESSGALNRSVEFLPDDKRITERKAQGFSLTRPELAVILAYAKIHIKNEILKSTIPEHPFLNQIVFTAFPETLQKKYATEIKNHSLNREIVATQLSNKVVNEMGTAFVYNLQTETGASIAEILRAYSVVVITFDTKNIFRTIGSLDYKVAMPVQYELRGQVQRLVYLGTRWFLNHKALNDDTIVSITKHYTDGILKLQPIIPTLMSGTTKIFLDKLTDDFVNQGISVEIAHRVASARAMYTALNIVEVTEEHHFELLKAAEVYFLIGEQFNLLWFRDHLANDNREGYWDTLARLSIRDELDLLQKLLTVVILKHNPKDKDAKNAISTWVADHKRAMLRWESILGMLYNSTNIDYVMFFIALKELYNLIQ